MNIDPKRFQSVSVGDIKKCFFYIQNLRADDLRDFVNERQLIVLYFIIILGSLIGLGITAHFRFHEYYNYKNKVELLLSKEAPIHDYQAALKDRKAFMETIPPSLSEVDLISFISEAATGHNIQINSFETVRKATSGFFRTRSVRLLCSGATFQDALSFVLELEGAKHFVRVNSWSITSNVNDLEMVDNHNASVNSQTKCPLSMTLDVASIALVENDKKNIQKK